MSSTEISRSTELPKLMNFLEPGNRIQKILTMILNIFQDIICDINKFCENKPSTKNQSRDIPTECDNIVWKPIINGNDTLNFPYSRRLMDDANYTEADRISFDNTVYIYSMWQLLFSSHSIPVDSKRIEAMNIIYDVLSALKYGVSCSSKGSNFLTEGILVYYRWTSAIL